MLRFSLAYFSLCDCSRVVIFPSRHLSPCQHGEAHCRQYPCLWIHIDDALLLSCDSPPLLTTFGFSLQPRWEDGLSVMLIVFCALREPSVCLWQNSVGCQVIRASMEEGREVCRCNHEQLRNIHSTPRKHLHLLFSEINRFIFKRKFNLQTDHQLSCLHFVQNSPNFCGIFLWNQQCKSF